MFLVSHTAAADLPWTPDPDHDIDWFGAVLGEPPPDPIEPAQLGVASLIVGGNLGVGVGNHTGEDIGSSLFAQFYFGYRPTLRWGFTYDMSLNHTDGPDPASFISHTLSARYRIASRVDGAISGGYAHGAAASPFSDENTGFVSRAAIDVRTFAIGEYDAIVGVSWNRTWGGEQSFDAALLTFGVSRAPYITPRRRE